MMTMMTMMMMMVLRTIDNYNRERKDDDNDDDDNNDDDEHDDDFTFNCASNFRAAKRYKVWSLREKVFRSDMPQVSAVWWWRRLWF